jgi:hypothetical protein
VDIIIGCSLQRSDTLDALEIMCRFLAYNTNAYVVRSSVSFAEDSDVCGASMIVKCADGNPRLLIRILSRIFAGIDVLARRQIKSVRQDDILKNLAKNFLNQIRSYQNVGLKLYENVNVAGNYMARELYNKRISSDCVFSIKIPEPKEEDCERRELIMSAIKYGVLKPNDVSKINYGAKATLGGLYHLSYIFCPLFRIQPRVGKAVAFQTMKRRMKDVNNRKKKDVGSNGQLMFDFFKEDV